MYFRMRPFPKAMMPCNLNFIFYVCMLNFIWYYQLVCMLNFICYYQLVMELHFVFLNHLPFWNGVWLDEKHTSLVCMEKDLETARESWSCSMGKGGKRELMPGRILRFCTGCSWSSMEHTQQLKYVLGPLAFIFSFLAMKSDEAI